MDTNKNKYKPGRLGLGRVAPATLDIFEIHTVFFGVALRWLPVFVRLGFFFVRSTPVSNRAICSAGILAGNLRYF